MFWKDMLDNKFVKNLVVVLQLQDYFSLNEEMFNKTIDTSINVLKQFRPYNNHC